MKSKLQAPKNIDEYIADFSDDVQAILEKLRATIHKAAPEAEEAIKYQIPTFVQKGNLVHFAAWKYHIGFYPTSSGINHFREELVGYQASKGAVQFPLDKRMPFGLIAKVVKFRVKENLERAKTKGK